MGAEKRSAIRLERGINEIIRLVARMPLTKDFTAEKQSEVMVTVENIGKTIQRYSEDLERFAKYLNGLYPGGVTFGACYLRFGEAQTTSHKTAIIEVATLFKELDEKLARKAITPEQHAEERKAIIASVK